MGYFKYVMYIYLVAAVYFLYKSIVTWNDGTDQHWLFLIIAGLAVVMFWVRRKFAGRY